MVVLMIVLSGGREVKKWNDNDFRVATINDSGMVIRSVSWQRGMISELRVEDEVPVWVPEGMGWYRSDKIRRLLTQEKKEALMPKLVFYNFGVVPEVVIMGDDDNWLFSPETIKRWGWANYLRFWLTKSKMMTKTEEITAGLYSDKEKLDEIIQRDMADSKLLKEDLKLSVYNSSQNSGLAGFLGRVLELSGFTVIGVDNYSGEVSNCRILYGDKVEGTYGDGILRKLFKECEYEKDVNVNENEVELYFGDKFSQMLNYPSYVRTF